MKVEKKKTLFSSFFLSASSQQNPDNKKFCLNKDVCLWLSDPLLLQTNWPILIKLGMDIRRTPRMMWR